ncbi:MAG: SdrD B-like domain-containing protein [Thiolinea sp.]
MTAHIFKHDGVNWSTVLPTPVVLDYERDFQGYSSAGEYWHPWTDDYAAVDPYISGGIKKYPQPILGDIEFDDDGSIILGLIDRSTHQFGYANSEPNVSSPNTDVSIFAAGDILRVGFDATGSTLTLENNGQVYDGNGNLLSGVGTTSPTGPGGREFYADAWNGSGTATSTADTVVGSLALLPGSGELLYTSADRYGYYTAAAVFASNTDGSHTGGVTVYQDDSSGSAGTFSKGGGLGDIELICPESGPLPLQVGNRVWLDADGDGIQDAGEDGIDGVNVTLTCGGDEATTTTANGGEFYFSNAGGGNATFMDSGQACSLSIAAGQAPLDTYTLTQQNADGDGSNDPLTDLRDSDATDNGGAAEIVFTVGNAGENNHTLDFGFTEQQTVDIELTKLADKANARRGDTVVYKLTATNNGPADASGVQVTDLLPVDISYVSDDGVGAYDPNTGVWDIGNLGIGQAVTLEITVVVQ